MSKAGSSEPTAPHEKRRLGTEQSLRAALGRLIGGVPSHPSLRGRTYRLTVSALAREARVSRNTIYANHRSILDEMNLVDLQTHTPKRPRPMEKIAEVNALIEELRQQKWQLATENAALLKRAVDAEKVVDRLQKQNAKFIRELEAVHRPTVLAQIRT